MTATSYNNVFTHRIGSAAPRSPEEISQGSGFRRHIHSPNRSRGRPRSC